MLYDFIQSLHVKYLLIIQDTCVYLWELLMNEILQKPAWSLEVYDDLSYCIIPGPSILSCNTTSI